MRILCLLSLFSTLIFAADLRAQGQVVGNGGDGVICFDQQQNIMSVELLDYYEGRMFKNIDPYLGEAHLSTIAKVQLVLERLSKYSPDRKQIYQKYMDTFSTEALFLRDIDLVDIPDSGHIILPTGCKLAQLAVQVDPKYYGGKRYIFDLDLFEKMNSDQQAGLILHEILYRHAIESFHHNSIRVRHFNGLISDRDFAAKYNLQKFIDVLRLVEIGFSIEINNMMYYVDLNLTVSEKGIVTMGRFYGSYAIPLLGQIVKSLSGATIERFEDGSLRSIEVDPPESLRISDKYALKNTLGTMMTLRFDQSGELDLIRPSLNSGFPTSLVDLRHNDNFYVLQAEDVILQKSKPTILKTTRAHIFGLRVGGEVIFDSERDVQSAEASFGSFGVVADREVEIIGPVSWSSGHLKIFNLARAAMLPLNSILGSHVREVVLAGEVEVTPEERVVRGTLDYDQILPGYNGKPTKFTKGTRFKVNGLGWVIPE